MGLAQALALIPGVSRFNANSWAICWFGTGNSCPVFFARHPSDYPSWVSGVEGCLRARVRSPQLVQLMVGVISAAVFSRVAWLLRYLQNTCICLVSLGF